MTKSPFVADLTWDVVRDALAAGASAILPIGAGSKQHGLHMPLATDARQAERFAVEAAERAGGLIWPTLTYGYYPAFADYAGSVSLQQATFEALVRDVVESLLKQTASFVLVIDTGVSTIEPARKAIAATSAPSRVHHLTIYQGARLIVARDKIEQQDMGSHAEEIETSIMLALAPDAVDMTRAEASPPGRGSAPGPLSPLDPGSPNYAPSGSYGDPMLASVEKGQRLLAAIRQDIEEAISRAGTTTSAL
ncbi:MAG: creatininase family protein [Hyphomicrobium sp.]